MTTTTSSTFATWKSIIQLSTIVLLHHFVHNIASHYQNSVIAKAIAAITISTTTSTTNVITAATDSTITTITTIIIQSQTLMSRTALTHVQKKPKEKKFICIDH